MTARTNNSETSETAQALKALCAHLGRRDHSRLELQEKLAKHFAPEIIDEVFRIADTKGWLQSEAEIATHAALTFQRKLKSRLYIEAQLLKRGLPPAPHDDARELEIVRMLVIKKFGHPDQLEDGLRRQASIYLRNRGFEEHLIQMVVKDAEF